MNSHGSVLANVPCHKKYGTFGHEYSSGFDCGSHYNAKWKHHIVRRRWARVSHIHKGMSDDPHEDLTCTRG
jgi:hypothetical protein